MNTQLPDSYKDFFLLDPNIVFLNHGSFGATPRPVFEAYQKWQIELERQPVEFLGRKAGELMQSARARLGAYLHTAADNLVFVTNATHGLNIIAHSLSLGPDDEVLASDHEYGALDRTWRFLAGKHGFKYINIPILLPVTRDDDFVSAFFEHVNSHTRVIFLSHITSPTALIFPVQAICERARAAGILTVIDGAHAPGQIPLDLDALGADFYSGNLHKWLCAPKGSAFLYAAPRVQHLVEPLIVSWGWESENPGPSRFVDILEWNGTRDLSPFLASPAAIDFQESHSWDEVRARCHRLAFDTQRRITQLTGLPALNGADDHWFAQMATSPLPDSTDIVALKARLYDAYHIEVPLTAWEGRKLIRYSYQAYNDENDRDALLAALADAL
ncbi:selenocysteine lyase [Longilinea arvoryzae]|uniref:Selenocysteine lyase n=1 Tax=Longilinea arvoryzae TaxID=360412 RepID=A0A0S7BHW2_9CHLR|nr:aminotransferase class V-fold PLP-dependent enzyme [Longilinea arvoryzae]GAP14752.1 selenocysteine lyase [Longilinea arvoryzae]